MAEEKLYELFDGAIVISNKLDGVAISTLVLGAVTAGTLWYLHGDKIGKRQVEMSETAKEHRREFDALMNELAELEMCGKSDEDTKRQIVLTHLKFLRLYSNEMNSFEKGLIDKSAWKWFQKGMVETGLRPVGLANWRNVKSRPSVLVSDGFVRLYDNLMITELLTRRQACHDLKRSHMNVDGVPVPLEFVELTTTGAFRVRTARSGEMPEVMTLEGHETEPMIVHDRAVFDMREAPQGGASARGEGSDRAA